MKPEGLSNRNEIKEEAARVYRDGGEEGVYSFQRDLAIPCVSHLLPRIKAGLCPRVPFSKTTCTFSLFTARSSFFSSFPLKLTDLDSHFPRITSATVAVKPEK
nr:hypothetical protein Iba_chr08aCG12880 [Ipomoea batatas]GMD29477.1 hypothetical protein Iba_chr08fCG3490 [Ipomoea batatas]GMD62064.1 hypothetical protein Iba_scaffold225248CG0010 [Ipomoea batatas]GME01818.1 hypothetical protein Iba_scaffold599303CG0010 [Ipomoea batatas]